VKSDSLPRRLQFRARWPVTSVHTAVEFAELANPMTSTRDRLLPTPFVTWIDRDRPLPHDVRFIPRTIQFGTDLGTFLIVGGMFVGMGALIALLPPWHLERRAWFALLILAIVCGGLWLVPVLLLRRLIRTAAARRDQQSGCLRQGVFLGPEGLLVRLEPNQAYAISWARFVEARLFPPDESRDSRKRRLVIDTLDGTCEFFAERLTAGPDDIHRHVRAFHPSWTKPVARRRDRIKKLDLRPAARLKSAAVLFGAAMLLLGASTAGSAAAPASGLFALASGVGLLLGFAALGVAVVNVFARLLALKYRYRCPDCGRRIDQLFEALPDVRFYCRSCNVEWDTGLEERETEGAS
jgi:hypothetical protein